jgi:hypothetical protein
MSYDIQLFRIETKEREQKQPHCEDLTFFENEENLEPFTEMQMLQLKQRLSNYEYNFVKEDEYGYHFTHSEYGFALLTKRALYFTTSFNEDSIFEVGMTVSEFTDTGEFAKYDPQNDGWEEI